MDPRKTFTAEDENGTVYTIHLFVELVRSGTSRMPGIPEYKTADGDHVNHLGDGTYEILRHGFHKIIVRTTDPDAQ
jgi:hypothetical protein